MVRPQRTDALSRTNPAPAQRPCSLALRNYGVMFPLAQEHTEEEGEERYVKSPELHQTLETHLQAPSHLHSRKSAQQEAHVRLQGLAGDQEDTMGDAAHDAAAADAAAKWRAEKTQKSCMHSDKVLPRVPSHTAEYRGISSDGPVNTPLALR